jgi:hypothetical protein
MAADGTEQQRVAARRTAGHGPEGEQQRQRPGTVRPRQRGSERCTAQQAAGDQPTRVGTVGQPAHQRGGRAPCQLPEGCSQADGGQAEAGVGVERRNEEPEGRARADAERHQQRGGQRQAGGGGQRRAEHGGLHDGVDGG